MYIYYHIILIYYDIFMIYSHLWRIDQVEVKTKVDVNKYELKLIYWVTDTLSVNYALDGARWR